MTIDLGGGGVTEPGSFSQVEGGIGSEKTRGKCDEHHDS